MTQKERDEVQRMRLEGRSYTQIGDYLNISRNTVKSICQRVGIQPADITGKGHDSERCRNCGTILIQKNTGKRKLFCSDSCRRTWWKEHRDKRTMKSASKTKCAFCGCIFEDYDKNHRRYCSHGCYVRDRFGEKKLHDKRAI